MAEAVGLLNVPVSAGGSPLTISADADAGDGTGPLAPDEAVAGQLPGSR